MGGFKRLQPIILDGFSHGIQIGQPFDTSWGAAWLTSVYTDIDHDLFRNMDPIAFRRIRYGNNVAVLFGALVECAEFYELPSFWHVISQGFSASADAVKSIVTVIVAARKAVKDRYPTSASSQTARSADEWIDILDHRGQNTSLFQFAPSKEADLRARAAAFFKSQQKQWLNAAWVSLKDQPISTQFQLSSKGSRNDRPASPGNQSAYQAGSTSRSNPRKRSASPPPERSSKQARMTSTSATNHPIPVEAQTKVPLPESTNTPQASQHLVGIKLPTAPGGEPSPRSSWLLKAGSHIPSRPPSIADLVPLSDSSEHEGVVKLRNRISILEAELANAKAEPPSPSKPNGFDPQELKSTLSTITNAVSTLMESSHHIVDGLQSLQNDILSRPQPQAQQLLTPDPPAFEAKLDAQHDLLLAMTKQMAAGKEEPETVEEALGLVERDVRVHRERLLRLYHKMDMDGGEEGGKVDWVAGILAGMEDLERRIGEGVPRGGWLSKGKGT